MNISLIEAIQLASSAGILSGGLGVLKWAFSVEKRMQRLELIQELKPVKG